MTTEIKPLAGIITIPLQDWNESKFQLRNVEEAPFVIAVGEKTFKVVKSRYWLNHGAGEIPISLLPTVISDCLTLCQKRQSHKVNSLT